MTRKEIGIILDFLSAQTYQGEPILYVSVACDFVSRQHMIDCLVDYLSKVGEDKDANR